MIKISDLEKRITAIEGRLNGGNEKLNRCIDALEKVILQFADTYDIDIPEVRDLREEIR